MWTTILTVGLQLLGYILSKNAQDAQMMDLFYKFVEKIQGLYLKSAHLQQDAERRLKSIMEKPFVETP